MVEGTVTAVREAALLESEWRADARAAQIAEQEFARIGNTDAWAFQDGWDPVWARLGRDPVRRRLHAIS